MTYKELLQISEVKTMTNRKPHKTNEQVIWKS